MTVIFDDVTLQFARAPQPIFRGLSLDVRDGEFLSIVGPSGCGKSTLLRLIAGLLMPTAGTVRTRSSAAKPRSGGGNGSVRFGFVFQSPTLLPWRTAIRNLALPTELGRGAGGSGLVGRSDLLGLMDQVGLSTEDADKRPGELSGGMQMRLSLARALVMNPDVLLLDEPLAAVDDLLRMKLQEDIRTVHQQRHLTTVLVTHNLQEAVLLSDRVIVLQGTPARIVADTPIALPALRDSSVRGSVELAQLVNRLTQAMFGAVP